jgi:hypothetical protein
LRRKIKNAANPQLDRQAEKSMHDPMSYGITVRERQEPQGFWRFRLCANLSGAA